MLKNQFDTLSVEKDTQKIEYERKQTDVLQEYEKTQSLKIQEIKEEYERKLEQAQQSAIEEERRRANETKEKEIRDQALADQQKHQKEMIEMQQALMKAIQSQNTKSSERDQQTQAQANDELMKTNQILSETLQGVEKRNAQLQAKINSVKIYQRVFKHALSMQCKFCNVFFPSETFIDHVKSCTKESAGNRSHFFKIPLNVSIVSTNMVTDEKDNRTYTEHVIKVKFNG